MKEFNYDWIVDIVYMGEDKKDSSEITFILDEENLGEFLL